MLDTLRRVATPEGCELELRIAGPLTRVRAWLFDALLRAAALLALSSAASFGGGLGVGFFLVASFLIEWFYPVLFEVYMGGQTPGKRICNLMVVHDDGRPVNWSASFIRNTLRFVDFLPLLYGVGFVASLLNADGKRLGDLAAGTVVIHVEPAPAAQSPGKRADARAGYAEPPPLPLSLEEQQAVIEYHRRSTQLSAERVLELATLPQPLTGGLTPEAARQRLLAIGNHLLGWR